MTARRTRRGGLLLEVIFALAIFVVAGGAILNLVGQTMSGLERSRLQARAADLARSAMAKIEAGIETAQTLHGPVERQAEGSGTAPAPPSGWELEIDTEPSQFRGLTRVSVVALKRGTGKEVQVEAEYKLVQLVRLSGKGEDRAGEEDALAEKAREGLAKEKKPETPGRGGQKP